MSLGLIVLRNESGIIFSETQDITDCCDNCKVLLYTIYHLSTSIVHSLLVRHGDLPLRNELTLDLKHSSLKTCYGPGSKKNVNKISFCVLFP